MLIGIPVGYLIARTKPYRINFIRAMITAPFLFPPLAILLGFVLVFDSNGYVYRNFDTTLFSPFSFYGIIVIHTMYNISVMARISESAFINEPEELHEMALTLGASRWNRFRTITVPHIRPSVEAASLLVFLYAFNSFAIVLILGEVRLQTLEVMLYYQSRVRLRYDRAVILAIIQLLINSVVILIYTKRKNYQTFDFEGRTRSQSENRFLPSLILIIVLFVIWFPIIMVFQNIISEMGSDTKLVSDILFSTEYNQVLGTSSFRIIINTLVFAILSAVVTIIFSICLIYFNEKTEHIKYTTSMISFITILPMATSSITLSFAILLLYGNSQLFTNNVWVFIIAAHIIASLPFSSSIMFSAWKRMPKDFVLVSKTFGASDFYTFRKIVITYLKPALLVSAVFSIAISVGEFGATFFLSRGEWITISLAINRLFTTRSALLPNLYAAILILFSISLFWLIERIGKLEMKI
jgi:thiamine transport system permease protein